MAVAVAVAVGSAKVSGVGAVAVAKAEAVPVSAVVSVSVATEEGEEDCEGRLLARGWRCFRFPTAPPLVSPSVRVPGVVDDKGDIFQE